jgi:soluble lytic murein transglycosylase
MTSMVRCGMVMGSALTFLLCSTLGTVQHTAAADFQTTSTVATVNLSSSRFDLRATGFDLRNVAKTSPILAQFRQSLLAERSHTDSFDILTGFEVLTQADTVQYRAAFAAAQDGDAATTAQTLNSIQDPVLRGTVQATFLLSPKTKASYTELCDWLRLYRTEPLAPKIYALALQRRPKGSKAPLPPQMAAIPRGMFDETGRGLIAQIKTESVSTSTTTLEQAQSFNALIRQGQTEAAAALLAAQHDNPDFPAQWHAEGAAALAALQFYAGLPSTNNTQTPLGAWIAGLQAWKNGHYSQAADAFTAMVSQDDMPIADRAAGYFWQGRAQQKLGNLSAAKLAWRKAATFPHCFYGQLANAKLGSQGDYSWSTPPLTRDGLQSLAEAPAGKRGLALLQLGMNNTAEEELRRVALRGQTAQAFTLAALAHNAQLPMLAMQLGSLIKHPNGKLMDSALYPVPPWQVSSTTTEPALVYAVMRHESGFNPTTTSSAGARGVMQLMPDTARHVDAELVEARLCEPAYNVTLGTRYLDTLTQLPTIRQNLLLLVAAYNSGPGNLQRWQMATTQNDDPLLFIETLPVRETRHYVQNIMSSYWVYQARLGTKSSSLQQLAQGQWPKITTKTASADSLHLASK